MLHVWHILVVMGRHRQGNFGSWGRGRCERCETDPVWPCVDGNRCDDPLFGQVQHRHVEQAVEGGEGDLQAQGLTAAGDALRHTLAARVAHRFTSSTFRAEERVYFDSWGLKASTTDARFLIDFTKDLRAWPHLRVHAQDGVDFWQTAYASETASSQGHLTNLVVPYYRTGDRELGPLFGLTLGAGARYAFGEKKTWAVSVLGDVIYTRFLDHLYLFDRLGFLGATTLEVDFE